MVALRDRRVKLHSTALWQRIRQYNFKATCHYEAELSNLLVLLRLPAPVAIQLSLLLWLPAHNRILIVLRTVNGIPSDDHVMYYHCWQRGDDYSCFHYQFIATAAACVFSSATQCSALLNFLSLTCSHDCHHSIQAATHIDFVLSLNC